MNLVQIFAPDQPSGHTTLIGHDHHQQPQGVEQPNPVGDAWQKLKLRPSANIVSLRRLVVDYSIPVQKHTALFEQRRRHHRSLPTWMTLDPSGSSWNGSSVSSANSWRS